MSLGSRGRPRTNVGGLDYEEEPKTQSILLMKQTPFIAILLVVAGVIALAYQGFTYTTREKAVDLGPFQITADKSRTIPLPPIVGIAMLGAGIFLLVQGRRTA